MALTKKHFIAIAASINAQIANYEDGHRSGYISAEELSCARGALAQHARCLCTIFRGENPNFDGDRFMGACGFDTQTYS